MFDFGRMEWQRTLVAGVSALLISTSMIVAAAAPVEAAQTCLLVSQGAGGGQLVCSHA